MGQLLVTLIVPPIVGLVTYIVIRCICERDENGDEAVSRARTFRCNARGRETQRRISEA